MAVRWVGAVDLGSGWLRYQGPAASADLHAHHAIQVIVSSHPVTLSVRSGAYVTTVRAVIPADVEHRIEAEGQPAVLTYLEPPSVTATASTGPADWARAGAALDGPGVGSPLGDVADLRRQLALAGVRPGHEVGDDGLVRLAMAEIRDRLPGRVRLTDIAAHVSLSPGRLTHRFSAEAGIPFGRWVLWERLSLAGNAVAEGADLTEAAHRSGFADSAHLSRTFRRMFGIAPSEVTSAVRWRVHP